MRNREVSGTTLRVGAAVVLAFAGASMARADESREALEQRVKDLETQLSQVRDELRGGYFTASSDLAARVSELERMAGGDCNAFTTCWKNGAKSSTADGAFANSWGGFVLYNWIWYGNDGSNDYSDNLNPDFGFTNIRLHTDGKMYGNIKYKVDLGFAGGDVAVKDVWLELANCNFGNLRLGHFKEPFCFDELTSELFTPFMARNSVSRAFAPARNTGAMVHGTYDESILYQVGIFRNAGSSGNDVGNPETGEYNVTARLSGRPVVEDEGRTWLHLGLSGSLRDFDGSTSDDPDTVTGGIGHPIPFTPAGIAGAIPTDDGWLYGVEAMYNSGPWAFMGEWSQAHADLRGGSGFTADALALQATYWLTGETNNYLNDAGVIGRVAPKQNYGDGDGSGAWQVGLRWDRANFDDGDLDAGDADTWTVAINWWLNPNTRFSFNWVHGEFDVPGTDLEDVNGLAFQFQWDF